MNAQIHPDRETNLPSLFMRHNKFSWMPRLAAACVLLYGCTPVSLVSQTAPPATEPLTTPLPETTLTNLATSTTVAALPTRTRLPVRTATPMPFALLPARRETALAYDQAHEALVLFGGIGPSPQGLLNDTWVWDGTNWALQPTASVPPARIFASMAYHPPTQTIILFGGTSEEGLPLGDTWIWDGQTWAQPPLTTSPQARTGASLVYDELRQAVMLFGGAVVYGRTLQSLNDTWIWDGHKWTELYPAVSPPPRLSASMAYDAAHQTVVLFGGGDGMRLITDTWLWNGHTWAEQQPQSSPSKREQAAIAYDEASQQLVLFGGSRKSDTWRWDGVSWAQVEAQVPTKDVVLEGHLIYDSTKRVLLLYAISGNRSGTPSLWTWNGKDWIRPN